MTLLFETSSRTLRVQVLRNSKTRIKAVSISLRACNRLHSSWYRKNIHPSRRSEDKYHIKTWTRKITQKEGRVRWVMSLMMTVNSIVSKRSGKDERDQILVTYLRFSSDFWILSTWSPTTKYRNIKFRSLQFSSINQIWLGKALLVRSIKLLKIT